ncbi:MAG: amidase [Candidatus Solibacter usitatus]|nr:amidase [Candidatus Solibacter usitatus]
MVRRTFLGTGAAAVLTSCVRVDDSHGGVDLLEMSLADVAEGLKTGRWTSRGLAGWYLERIEAVDRRGPKLNSVIELNPRAREEAAELDRERREKGPRSPLHGVPLLLKDNIDTADGMTTTAGSLALEGWRPPRDAAVAAALRSAGALFLGKTNLSEWANFRSTHSSSGWSGRGGQTKNPYALDRNPSGSSSGSGVAVAASLCAAAVGTETDGSVISPASINGIVGLKPTVGLLGGAGIIPIAHSQDTAGPMARTVRDAALLLAAMGGRGEYLKALDRAGLKGARIGIARKFYEKHADLDRILTSQVDVLRRCGAEVIDEADLPSHGKWSEPEGVVLRYEFKAGLNAYLGGQPESRPVRSMAQLIEFNEKNRAKEMPWFNQEILVQTQAKGPLTEKAYLDARRDCLRLSRDEGIDAVMARHALDAVVTLSSGPAWLTDWVNGDSGAPDSTTPAAVAGYPHITVPAAFHRGLPVGLSFFGRAWSEPVLFRLAYAYEQETKARRKPGFAAGGPSPEKKA